MVRRRRDQAVRAEAAGHRQPRARPRRAAARTPTVIVGYDGSDEARAALSVGLEHGGARGTVVVVHAIPPMGGASAVDRDRRFDELTLAAAAQRMQPLREADTENPCEISVIRGDAAEVISRLAVARDADLIVVGARGRGRRTALGSILSALLHQASCPVLVVPAGGDAGR